MADTLEHSRLNRRPEKPRPASDDRRHQNPQEYRDMILPSQWIGSENPCDGRGNETA
jgi:hypothetical protein